MKNLRFIAILFTLHISSALNAANRQEVPGNLDEVVAYTCPEEHLRTAIVKDPHAFDWLPDSPERESIIEKLKNFRAMEPLPTESGRNLGYSFCLSEAHVQFLRAIRDFISANERVPRILDVGCGYGNMSLAAHWAGADVVGIDPFNSNVAFQRFVNAVGKEKTGGLIRSRKISFQLKDIFDYSAEESFDFVWCYSVQQTLQPTDHSRFYEKLTGFLNPGGQLYLTCQAPLSIAAEPCFRDNCKDVLSFMVRQFMSGDEYAGYNELIAMHEGEYANFSIQPCRDITSIPNSFYREINGTRETHPAFGAFSMKGDLERIPIYRPFYTATLEKLHSFAEAAGLEVLETKGLNFSGRFFHREGELLSYVAGLVVARKPQEILI